MPDAGDNVEITMSAKDKAVLEALQQIERGLRGVGDRMTDVERRSRDATKHTVEGFDNVGKAIEHAGKELLAFSGSFLTIERIAEKFKEVLDEILKRQEKAAGSQVDYGKQLKQTVLGAGGFLKANEVDVLAKNVAAAAGTDVQHANAALKAAFEGFGVKNKAEAVEITKTVVDVLALYKDQDAGTVAEIAGEAARVQKMGGPGTTSKGAIGMLQRIAQEAGLSGPEALAKKGIPAIKLGVASGMTVGESGATLAALGHSLEDPTGKLAKTAFDELVTAIRHHFPDVKDPAEIIEKIQAGGDVGKKLLARLHSKQWVHGKEVPEAHWSDNTELAIEALLTGRDRAGKPSKETADYRRLKGQLGDFRQGEKFFKGIMEDLETNDAVRKAEREDVWKAMSEAERLANKKEADIPIDAKGLEEYLADSGAAWDERLGARQDFQHRTQPFWGGHEDPAKVAEDLLTKRLWTMEHPKEVAEEAEKDTGVLITPEPMTDEIREKAARLREGIARLRKTAPRPAGAAGDAENEKARMGTGEPGGAMPNDFSATPGVGPPLDEFGHPLRRNDLPAAKTTGAPRTPSNVRISWGDFKRETLSRGLDPNAPWAKKAFGPGVSAYADVVEQGANEELGRQQFQRERYDSRGNVTRVDQWHPGDKNDPITGHQEETMKALGDISKKMDKLIEQGEKPTQVVNASPRPQIPSQSSAGGSLSR